VAVTTATTALLPALLLLLHLRWWTASAFTTVERTVDRSERCHRRRRGTSAAQPSILLFGSVGDGNDDDPFGFDGDDEATTISGFFVRERVRRLTKKIVPSLSSSSSSSRTTDQTNGVVGFLNANGLSTTDDQRAFVDAAFGPAEESLREAEESLASARTALADAKLRALEALGAVESAAAEIGRTTTTASVVVDGGYEENESDLLAGLTFEDVDYGSSEMAPPFLDQDSCLMPDAEPVVRVEKAPDNSRRIFAGIDIAASTDDVWKILTNYGELQNVIPNLVVNEVLDLYEGDDRTSSVDDDDASIVVPEEVRCENLSKMMRGSLLRQVGGAKVAGINFSAKTTLEVREWPTGMPGFAHFLDEMWEGRSREDRARECPRIKLKRYRFPRPFAVSNLPTRDISMQSVADDSGEFRLYQGVWRMQPLVGCAPPGEEAMRLTYAVEISPRLYLPVKLIEGRIVADLCANLEAIRKVVTERRRQEQMQRKDDDTAGASSSSSSSPPPRNGKDRSMFQNIDGH